MVCASYSSSSHVHVVNVVVAYNTPNTSCPTYAFPLESRYIRPSRRREHPLMLLQAPQHISKSLRLVCRVGH